LQKYENGVIWSGIPRQSQLIALLNPKLVAMATSLSTAGPPSNTWFLGPIRVHSPNSKSIGSAVSAQLTTESAYTLQWGPIPSKLPLFTGTWTHMYDTIPWTHPSPQTKRHHFRFSRFCTDDRRVSLYFTTGRTFPPSKLPLPMGDLDPIMVPWAHPSTQPKWHLDRFSRFCRTQ